VGWGGCYGEVLLEGGGGGGGHFLDDLEDELDFWWKGRGIRLDLEVWRVVRMGSLSGLDGWDRIGLCSGERRESELVVVIDG
jgi:hypothetical protein